MQHPVSRGKGHRAPSINKPAIVILGRDKCGLINQPLSWPQAGWQAGVGKIMRVNQVMPLVSHLPGIVDHNNMVEHGQGPAARLYSVRARTDDKHALSRRRS